MKDCKLVGMPIEYDIKLLRQDDDNIINLIYFKSLVGSLRYLTCMRPDILYGIRLVS